MHLDVSKQIVEYLLLLLLFTNDTRDAAKQLNIALVDGEMLTNLMIQYKVGVQVSQTYELYDIDDDFLKNKD